MKTFFKVIFISLFLLTLIYTPSKACTTFCLHTENALIFGRNYDWQIGYGIVFVNKKNVTKTALSNSDKPAEWISKFGSVTFNQFGREFPTGGMNESGLVVELMWLDGTEYPDSDGRSETGGILQWIQYQLDNCETVAEVIETDKLIRIPKSSAPIHYLVSDRFGNSATIEFLNGELAAHSGKDLIYPVLANETYESSVSFLKQLKGFGGNKELINDYSSNYRFAKACTLIKDYKDGSGESAVDYSFDILDKVSQGESTKWSIVYDIKNMKIFYRTLDNKDIRSLEFSGLDFNCDTPVKMTDIDEGNGGSIIRILTDYNFEDNRELIEKSYSSVDFLKNITDESKDIMAQYPGKLYCVNKSDAGMNLHENSNDQFNNSLLGLLALITLIFLSASYYRKMNKI